MSGSLSSRLHHVYVAQNYTDNMELVIRLRDLRAKIQQQREHLEKLDKDLYVFL